MHGTDRNTAARIVDNRQSAAAGNDLQSRINKNQNDNTSVLPQKPVQQYSQQVLQAFKGNAGLENVKLAIHKGTSSAKQIAQDIYNVEVGNDHDGDFTADTASKIKKSAKKIGYSDAYATRLADKNPFGKADIKTNTAWESQPDRHVESFEFQQINDPHGHTVSRHQLNFENLYPDNGNAVFRFNARNPALADFYASDVVDAQLDWIKTTLGNSNPPDLGTITRENVSSENGAQWRVKYPGWGKMSSVALQDFLSDTDNGKSSVSLLRGTGLIITDGEVIKYDPNDPTSDEWSVKLTLEEPIIPLNFFDQD